MELTTGLELELLLPEGMTRIDLLERLAAWSGGRVEPFDFPSKVPVPHTAGRELEGDDRVEAVMAAMRDIARHHEAQLHSIAQDGRFFFLSHRSGRVVDRSGAPVVTVVHDNTIAGGNRVAEVITPPLLPAQVEWLRSLIAELSQVPGIEVPPRSALHVHVDGRRFCDVGALTRLVELYQRFERDLRRWLGTPEGFHAGRQLPAGLLHALRERAAQPWSVARPALARFVGNNRCGLNLYNVLHDVRDKRTVELKLAAGSLDSRWVLGVRALFLGMAQLALDGSMELSREARDLWREIDPAGSLPALFEATKDHHPGRGET